MTKLTYITGLIATNCRAGRWFEKVYHKEEGGAQANGWYKDWKKKDLNCSTS